MIAIISMIIDHDDDSDDNEDRYDYDGADDLIIRDLFHSDLEFR